ncbi:phosphoribosyl-ATP diphosphatase [Limibacillus halophilus]|jgi:phosphoribosyl-ATP pyrophosphohydrolase
MSKTSPDSQVLERLFAVIESRKGADPESSYTAKLFGKGLKKISQKLGEESSETIIAALVEDEEALAGESADLLYHLLVLWSARGLDPQKVWAKLAEREGVSGLEEKAARKKGDKQP